VILITSLVMSLWAARFASHTPMLFALRFRPCRHWRPHRLPLAWRQRVALHDTTTSWRTFINLSGRHHVRAVCRHYHWFPRITARTLDRAGRSLLGIVRVHEPDLHAHVVVADGVNRRLYDAGASYALAQPTLMWQTHMTYGRGPVGVFQLPSSLEPVDKQPQAGSV